MDRAGAALTTYEVDDEHVVQGPWEVAFIWLKAVRVKMLPTTCIHWPDYALAAFLEPPPHPQENRGQKQGSRGQK